MRYLIALASLLLLSCNCTPVGYDMDAMITHPVDGDYTTYADGKFLLYTFGELGQCYTETLTVKSKTIRENGAMFLRLTSGDIRAIIPPDFVEEMK